MTGHGAKFDRKKDEAIAALLSHKSLEDAARAIGVNPNTLTRWKKETEFLEGLEEARRLMYSEAIERLRSAAGAAASTVLKVMINPSTPPAVKLKAAEIVLDKAEVTKGFEHRLEVVEALLQSALKSSMPSTGERPPIPTLHLGPPAGTSDPAQHNEIERERVAS